jgi:hypothetical protein
MLPKFAFETTAEVVLVADESLSGALSQKLAFGCQEAKEGPGCFFSMSSAVA